MLIRKLCFDANKRSRVVPIPVQGEKLKARSITTTISPTLRGNLKIFSISILTDFPLTRARSVALLRISPPFPKFLAQEIAIEPHAI